jgi:hypothetical protein
VRLGRLPMVHEGIQVERVPRAFNFGIRDWLHAAAALHPTKLGNYECAWCPDQDIHVTAERRTLSVPGTKPWSRNQ